MQNAIYPKPVICPPHGWGGTKKIQFFDHFVATYQKGKKEKKRPFPRLAGFFAPLKKWGPLLAKKGRTFPAAAFLNV